MTIEVKERATCDAGFDPFAGPALARTSPATEPQREIWNATRMGIEASLAFNESVALHFEGDLDVEALRSSARDLVVRHDALRSTFSSDGLTICVADAIALEVPLLDFTELSDAQRDAAWRALLAREVEEPFDLEGGPLVRIRLARLGESRYAATLTAHHIVLDGWSTAVLVKDWAELYSARHRGERHDMPPAVPFSAYAREQAMMLGSPEHAASEAHWLTHFADGIPALDLPSDRRRPPGKTYFSRREDRMLDGELLKRLRHVSAAHRTSLFTLLLAGFGALLHRLTGQSDLVVGIPAAGQAVGDLRTLVGHCVNTLPLRIRVDGTRPVRELVDGVRAAMLDAYDYQQCTLGAILRKLPIARDPGRLPLSVVFNVDRGISSDALCFGGLRTELTTNPRHFETFELFVNVVEFGDKLIVECQFNTDLFDASTVRRWLAAYELVLREVADDTSRELYALRVVTDEELALFAAWNETRQSGAGNSCLEDVFAEQARRAPNAPALSWEDRALTYGELDARSNRLARRLLALGVGLEERVGVCLERSPELIVALLAIVKAGGAYVPLEPSYPDQRIAFMLADAQAKVVVTDSLLRSRLPAQLGRAVLVDEDRAAIEAEDGAPLSAMGSPESLAYVMYTSGSTGTPKGAEIPHRAIIRLVCGVDYVSLGPEHVVLHAAPAAFDASTFEIWGALLTGARLVLHPERVPSARGLGESIARHGVTTAWLTAALFNAIADDDPSQLRGLSQILTGGEAASVAHVRRVLDALPGATIINGYGPTETTTFAATHIVERPLDPQATSIPIGRPIQDTQLFVLDERRQRVPIGVTGELYIGGAGLARGYLRRPELTAERFVESPFERGTRLYRTGDLVRYRADGVLEFLGRADSQIKLRGFRIELGEIEVALSRHGGVRQVAVILREDHPGDKRLVAYVVPEPSGVPGPGPLSDADLRTHLKATLPDYMIPADVVILDVMPLTPSGKVDRRRLPAPSRDRATRDDDFVAPRTPAEKLVERLWREALSVDRVSVHDDFFRLGGHSLLASQVLSRLRRDHGVELSFRNMFESPTVATFAALVDQRAKDGPSHDASTIPRRASGGPAPLSVVQERLLLLEELSPHQRLVHNVPAAWRLRGPLDAVLLKRALDEIVLRHEILRTHVRTDGGRQVQVVAENLRLPLELVDLRDRPRDVRESAMFELFDGRMKELFDPCKPPLLRATLVRLDEHEWVMFTLRHTLIWDGWSFDVFLAELSTVYGAFARGEPPRLPELSIAYADFAVWQREWLKGSEIARQRAFWTRELEASPPDLFFPTDHPRPSEPTHAGGNEGIELSRAETDALLNVARETGATLFMILFAAWVTLLHRYAGQKDVLVGTPVRARTRPELEPLIGYFVNTLVLRTRIESSMTFRALLGRVRDTTLDVFSHQDLPLELLGAAMPTVRAFFSLQDARARPPSLGDVALEQVHVLAPSAANDLMLWTMETRRGLLAMLNFSTELFDRDTAVRLLAHYRELLRSIVQDPGSPLGRLGLASDGERAAVLAVGEPRGAATSRTVHEVVALHGQRQGKVVAIEHASIETTYAELDARANRLARLLLSRGIEPGARVAVWLGRRSDVVVTMLAVLKIGGAIVPLDPDLPAARRAAFVADARAALLICRRRQLAASETPMPAPVLYADEDERDPIDDAQAPAGAGVAPEALACVLYTSSDPEGRPLGVKLSHRAIVTTLTVVGRELGLGIDDTVMAAPSLPVDATLVALLLPLVVGGRALLREAPDDTCGASSCHTRATLVVAPSDGWRDSKDEWVTDGRPFTAMLVGSPPSVRSCDDLRAAGARVLAAYGHPEAGICAMLREATSPEERATLGRPLAHVRARVLDPLGQTSPLGVPGELHLGGAALFDGFWHGEAAMDARLVVDPLLPGASLFKTGDRVRLREDGAIEHLGRLDDQVVVGGYRIEPREVARALRAHPAVRDALVVAHEGAAGEGWLAAYVVTRPGVAYTETELRRHLARTLPRWMVPRAFVELGAIPFTADGRVDRARLPAPFGADRDVVLPRSHPERLVAEIWQEALSLPSVSLYDNLFDLGGNSLLCFQVIARIEERTGKRLSPRVLLLDSLEHVAAQLPEESVPPPPAAPRAVEPEALPLRALRKAFAFMRRA